MTFPLTDNSALGTPRGHSEKRGTDGHNRRASALGNLFIPTEGFSPSGGIRPERKRSARVRPPLEFVIPTEGFSPSGGICGCVGGAARARSRGPHLRAAFARNGVEEGGTIVAQGGSPESTFYNETEPRRGDTGSEMSPAKSRLGIHRISLPRIPRPTTPTSTTSVLVGDPGKALHAGLSCFRPARGTGAMARQAFTPHPCMHRQAQRPGRERG